MKRSLPISEWHQLAQEGAAPPVRIQLSGNSMFPLIRHQRDYVIVISPDNSVSVGDIVLLCESGSGRYVMHRVWQLKEGKALMWGDNCGIPDGWFPMDAVLGKIVLVERGKRIIHPNSKKGLRRAKVWHKIRPAYYFVWRMKQRITRRIKRLRV